MDLSWVHEKDSFIVALILTIVTLGGVIVILWKSSNKKDALIVDLAKESVKVITGVQIRSEVSTKEIGEVLESLRRVGEQQNQTNSKLDILIERK